MKKTFLLLVVTAATLTAFAGTFRQFPEQKLSLVIPSGFTELKADRVPAGCETAYVDGDPNDGQVHIAISVQILDGVIRANSHLTNDQIPRNLRDQGYTLGRLMWGTHSIDTINGELAQSGITVYTIAAQIPIAPKALQLNFAGPVAEKEKIKAYAAQVVASVIGQSNWNGPAMRELNTTERVASVIKGLVGLFLTCAFAILIYRAVRKKKA